MKTRRIARIWYEGWDDGHRGNVPDALAAARTSESFSERVEQRIADTVVATVEEAVAGFVMAVEDEVEQVYVARQHCGTDVATALLAEAECIITANGHEPGLAGGRPG
ncbi:hypothetical protein [Nonomuraea sp. NPDC005650]|uniref:hypothetical protein n=1 Tax=Nonomuraea sp. NPDC005650 TaxID=3157045 RepID=UPI0033AF6217